MKRRRFLATLGAASCAPFVFAANDRPRRILLRSSWQTVNIGDIGHSPGVIRLLGDHLPDAEITLWPANIGDGVEEMLRHNFPKLRIAKTAETVRTAFAECDFFLHGSGPSLVGQKQLAQWQRETGKPYGIYGITLGSLDAEARELINGARFIYFRDTLSLQWAKDHGLKCALMGFAPDGAFGVNLRDGEAATAFLREHKLEDGRFICAIPRLRYTPYWKIHGRPMTDEDRRRDAISQERKAGDHAKLRAALVAFVRETGMKVLVCPEDRSHMEIGRDLLVEPLPEDVKSRVVWRERYWLTDEAVSTYTRALALLSMDMHSPIMAVANGTPAIHCRFAEQTSKGQMWRDVGLGEWLFDLDDEPDGARITATLLTIAREPAAASAKVEQAMEFVRRRQRETMAVVAKNVA